MDTRKKQKLIIGTLIALIVGLVVGYAALSQILTITGTSGITGDFKIEFTKIEENLMVNAKTIKKDGVGSTTATFTVDLEKPGSSALYDLTVENKGTIDAILTSIEGVDESNLSEPLDIVYSITGINEGDSLNVGEQKSFQVKVVWKASATTVPTTSKSLILKLNYEQNSVQKYNITYDGLGDYNMPDGYPTQYTAGQTLTLPIPTKAGHTFAGWYLNSNLTGSAVTEISSDVIGDQVFYPKWTVNEPQVPVVTTFNYEISEGENVSAISSMGVNATVTDGGTLSYSWDMYKFSIISTTGKPVPGARKVFSTFTGSEITKEMINEVMFAPWSRSSWMSESSIDPGTYGSVKESGIAGYCTIINTLNGKTKSVTVWVGTEETYKRMYNEAPKGTQIS